MTSSAVPRRLEGARAVVTGAGRGIGAAIARRFAAEGAAVVIGARTTAQVGDVADQITRAGGRAFAAPLDIADDASVSEFADSARAALGGSATVLVNNAGAYLARPFLDYEITDWERILDVNVLGTVRVTRAFLPGMLELGGGRIINVASTAAKWGTAGQSAYNVSKHAILGLTRCLALETAGAGVRVTAICPGWVDTELVDDAATAAAQAQDRRVDEVRAELAARAPIGRMASADEVAALAAYLASSEADAMTGVGVTIAGGMILI